MQQFGEAVFAKFWTFNPMIKLVKPGLAAWLNQFLSQIPNLHGLWVNNRDLVSKVYIPHNKLYM